MAPPPDTEELARLICGLHRTIKIQEEQIEILAGYYAQMHQLLTKTRKAVGHGKWLQWVADHEEMLGFGERQAQKYLREPESRDSDLEAHRQRQAEHRARERAAADEILEKAEASRLTEPEALNVAYSKTGRVQPKDDSEQRAAQDRRRATADAMARAGYTALVAERGDSSHLRAVRDELLRVAKRVA
jgi:hypothetical protein